MPMNSLWICIHCSWYYEIFGVDPLVNTERCFQKGSSVAAHVTVHQDMRRGPHGYHGHVVVSMDLVVQPFLPSVLADGFERNGHG
ncbi:unnamed protein product [Penicillium roqueforti FM164]|uniref:Genomic scaffold, ProqFM164S03 n=1 Tax=Penicillium roqueforti (strain FM164) TaxID=1365484 RepID=W6QEB5_PENRF|nr:unnamed protein product [Penicillium roqueforti FM164]